MAKIMKLNACSTQMPADIQATPLVKLCRNDIELLLTTLLRHETVGLLACTVAG
jgi:hypothetical protein